MRALIDKLAEANDLEHEEFKALLLCEDDYLFEKARNIRDNLYGKKVFIRGLIEFTSFCKNDCYYCGLRRSNSKAERYRLTGEQIIECCHTGYELGFRTFVLQGGEDKYFTDDILCSIVRAIREAHPDCAVTLSLGERSAESYKRLFDAGAERYLLRHETANDSHYRTLHPKELSLEKRKKCLFTLKEIGYKVGCGFMVGSPGQTTDNIVEDLLFIRELKPDMAGVGPFLPHNETPFKNEPAGELRITLNCLSILRLMRPNILLPATTALGTLDPKGRELGILAGANVVMPNLSPPEARKKYMLYNGKISAGEEAAESIRSLQKRVQSIGCDIVISKGDSIVL